MGGAGCRGDLAARRLNRRAGFRAGAAWAPDPSPRSGMTNQRETTIVWERKTGKPVAPAIVWQCSRTAAFCDALAAGAQAVEITQKTGLVIDAYFSGSKVRWILENVADAKAKARDGELLFGNVDTWLIWKLTNGAVHVTDYSNASRTMLMDLETGEWDEDCWRFSVFRAAMLPRIVSSSEVVWRRGGGTFGCEIPIAGIAGDQQAALFGQACFRPGLIQEHIWDWMFCVDAHGIASAGIAEQAAGDARGGDGWSAVCDRRKRIHRGRRGAMAARQTGDYRARRQRAEQLANRWRARAASILSRRSSGLGAPHWDASARGMLTRSYGGDWACAYRAGGAGRRSLIRLGNWSRRWKRIAEKS